MCHTKFVIITVQIKSLVCWKSMKRNQRSKVYGGKLLTWHFVWLYDIFLQKINYKFGVTHILSKNTYKILIIVIISEL
jgi:hypothetical protein